MKGIFFIVAIIASLFISLDVEAPENSVDCNGYAKEIYCLTNGERAKGGMRSLLYSPELEEVSRKKSQDMCDRRYFAHDYNGESWTRFVDDSGVDYKRAGENLTKGYKTATRAVQALVDSPTHYENIMGDYTHIGVYTEPCGGLNLTTQTFAKL